LTTAAVDGEIGGTHDALKIFGTTFRAFRFHGILATHRKELKELITF